MRWGQCLPETRFEEREEGQGVITGYAAVYYRSDDPGTEYTGLGFRERIAPGAFTQTVGEDDIRGLFDHDSSKVLGRTAAGTMTVSLTNRGLRYEIPYDEHDQDHRQVKRKLERGDITGSSFGFRVRGEDWSTEDGEDVRTLTDVQLSEVSVVTFPAYQSAKAGLREEDLAEIRSAHLHWQEQAGRLHSGLDLDEYRQELLHNAADHAQLWQAIRDLQQQLRRIQ